MQPSLAEELILTALLCVSLYAFWFRFRRVVYAIRAAKPDGTWSLRPLAPRIGRFVWEVLLQGKVIVDRPLPGLAHAFVFWGFCAFALVTINHVAEGFGATLIPRDSAFGLVYFGFVAAATWLYVGVLASARIPPVHGFITTADPPVGW